MTICCAVGQFIHFKSTPVTGKRISLPRPMLEFEAPGGRTAAAQLRKIGTLRDLPAVSASSVNCYGQMRRYRRKNQIGSAHPGTPRDSFSHFFNCLGIGCRQPCASARNATAVSAIGIKLRRASLGSDRSKASMRGAAKPGMVASTIARV